MLCAPKCSGMCSFFLFPHHGWSFRFEHSKGFTWKSKFSFQMLHQKVGFVHSNRCYLLHCWIRSGSASHYRGLFLSSWNILRGDTTFCKQDSIPLKLCFKDCNVFVRIPLGINHPQSSTCAPMGIPFAGRILSLGFGSELDEQTHLFPHLLQFHSFCCLLRWVLPEGIMLTTDLFVLLFFAFWVLSGSFLSFSQTTALSSGQPNRVLDLVHNRQFDSNCEFQTDDSNWPMTHLVSCGTLRHLFMLQAVTTYQAAFHDEPKKFSANITITDVRRQN